MTRAFLVGLMLALSVILASVGVATAVEASQTGTASSAKIALLLATLAALFVVGGVYAAQGRSEGTQVPHCHNCGRRVYATTRSLDRRAMLTCFTCGAEWFMPKAGPREIRAPLP